MTAVTIYTKSWCPYCAAAKDLLTAKKVGFTEIEISGKPDLRDEMMQRSGRATVPQIFIGETHVGGCDDLYALDKSGSLDPMLTA